MISSNLFSSTITRRINLRFASLFCVLSQMPLHKNMPRVSSLRMHSFTRSSFPDLQTTDKNSQQKNLQKIPFRVDFVRDKIEQPAPSPLSAQLTDSEKIVHTTTVVEEIPRTNPRVEKPPNFTPEPSAQMQEYLRKALDVTEKLFELENVKNGHKLGRIIHNEGVTKVIMKVDEFSSKKLDSFHKSPVSFYFYGVQTLGKNSTTSKNFGNNTAPNPRRKKSSHHAQISPTRKTTVKKKISENHSFSNSLNLPSNTASGQITRRLQGIIDSIVMGESMDFNYLNSKSSNLNFDGYYLEFETDGVGSGGATSIFKGVVFRSDSKFVDHTLMWMLDRDYEVRTGRSTIPEAITLDITTSVAAGTSSKNSAECKNSENSPTADGREQRTADKGVMSTRDAERRHQWLSVNLEPLIRERADEYRGLDGGLSPMRGYVINWFSERRFWVHDGVHALLLEANSTSRLHNRFLGRISFGSVLPLVYRNTLFQLAPFVRHVAYLLTNQCPCIKWLLAALSTYGVMARSGGS